MADLSVSLDDLFIKNELIPAIIVDYKDNAVLMLAYMNKESLQLTIDTGKTWFWSRSRSALWNKGETSGHFQFVKDFKVDCDNDTLLISVEQVGVACHTGHRSCFFKNIKIDEDK